MTLIVFLLYTQIENHVLNPVIMSRTVRINPRRLVLISILVGASISGAGFVGSSVASLSRCCRSRLPGALQVIVREIWRSTDPEVLNPAIGDPAVPAAGPGGLSALAGSAAGSPRTGSAPAVAGRARQERRAVPRLAYQWSRRLPGRRPDSAGGPPA